MPVALVTGGSSGLGYSFCELLGRQGYKVIIVARDIQRINHALINLSKLGIQASGFPCNVTNATQLTEVASRVRNESGNIDYLILNAGSVSTKLIIDYESPEELKSDVENDLWGTILSAYIFVPLLNDGSKVLMTSSGFGLIGSAGYSTYCAAKAGIINFGESLRRELLYRKIGVYVSVPGDMDTPQFEAEIAGQPVWMKEQSSPRKLMQTQLAAKRILTECHGHSKFLIVPSSDVKLLLLVSKVLPRRLKDKLLDNMFPRPGKK